MKTEMIEFLTTWS